MTRPVEDTTWRRTRDGWGEHIRERYHHPLAIKGAAMKYRLGPLWVDDLARRLVDVTPPDADGARLTPTSAWKRVEGWYRAGEVAAAVGAQRARAA